MAQWRLDNRTLGQPGNRFEVMMIADEFGNIVNLAGAGSAMAAATSAYGEPIAIPITPVVQVDGIYGYDSRKFFMNDENGGSTNVSGLVSASTGTSANGFASIRSRRAVRYRPGQGSLARFTAMFSEPVEGYVQLAGFQSEEHALMIGYNGTQFGVLRRTDGKVHIHRFIITAIPTGTETVYITLDDDLFTVNVAAANVNAAATIIGYGNYGANWRVEHYGDTIDFIHDRAGVLSGEFSLVTEEGGTLTANSVTVRTGANFTNNWTYQTDWSQDTLTGTGRSQMVLDPQKLNVYQIDFRWLGAGEIRFSLENHQTGDMMTFHHIHYTNRYVVPHIEAATLQIGYSVYANSTGTSNVTVSGASLMGAIQGLIAPTELPISVSTSRADTMNTGSVYHLLTTHNRIMINGKMNEREAILKHISAGCTAAAGASAKLSLYILPVYNANLEYSVVNLGGISSLLKSTTPTTINTTSTLSSPVIEFHISSGSTQNIDVSPLRIVLWPGAHLAAAISSGGTIQTADVALTWLED